MDSKQKAPALTCPDGSRPRVLLAEDSLAARVLTAALLRRMGCDVDAVEHGEEAVEHIQSSGYDVVLMDIEMPVMDGLLAAREIRSLGGEAARTPIIALSAFMADSRKAPMWRETFDVSLPKPAGRDQLRSVIQAALDARPCDSAVTSQQEPADEELAALVDDAEIDNFISQMSRGELYGLLKTACAEVTAAAGRLVQAVDAEQLGEARQAAHKIRGIAATFAAPRLLALAAHFEAAVAAESERELELLARRVQDCAEQTASALFKAAS
jgi:CheY-like chemotaxis protein